MQTNERGSGRLSSARWTLVVVLVGLGIGAVFFFLPRPTSPREPYQTLASIDIFASWVSLTLIVALLFIESKTYWETKSPLALGLFVVFGAFLFQAILTSPTFFAAFGRASLGGLPSLVLAADIVEAFAFSVFLYLNL